MTLNKVMVKNQVEEIKKKTTNFTGTIPANSKKIFCIVNINK